MITFNVLSRTFYIKYGDSTGTCFTIDVDNKQYFVTAKHVVNGLKDGDDVDIFYKNSWAKVSVKLIGHSSIADVSVFAIGIHISGHSLPATTEGITYGQDLYFLGFPYGIKSEIGTLMREFPLPFVKKGILSAMFFDEPDKRFFIDGHNNPGFSGGPVVYKLPNTQDFKVAGIISSYVSTFENTFLNGNTTPIQTRINTGIITAYSIEIGLDLISSRPDGLEILG